MVTCAARTYRVTRQCSSNGKMFWLLQVVLARKGAQKCPQPRDYLLVKRMNYRHF